MAPLSDEEENYVRLALLLKGVTPRAVRTYFDREFPPTYLPSTLNKNYNTLWDLKLKRVINQAQWNILIPRNGIPDSKTFDVTLMICLIRNLTSINPPINGFDSLPPPGETTPGSDLARIKYYRNKLAHHDSNTIDSTYFNTAWTDISNAVGRLGGPTMYQECQELKVKTLDQSNQEIILEIKHSLEEMKELRLIMDNWGKEHSTMTENLRELQSSHSKLTTSHSNLQAEHVEVKKSLKDPIPAHIRDQFKKQIEDWEEQDKMFVSTRASDYVMECLQDNSCVTLTAPSGAGKSFISRHTALVLQKEGYTIIPVYSPTDIRDYHQPGMHTVFNVDDMCGNFTANQQQIHNWKQLLPVINKVITDKCCKIIVSCRLQVFKDEKFNVLSPFKSCECNLVSDKLCLTFKEKRNIAKTYIGTRMQYINIVYINSDFFPLLCSLCHQNRNANLKDFFKRPFDVYKSQLDTLSEHGDEGNFKICGLALNVLFNNQLEEKWFQGKVTDAQRHIIEDTCDACDINRSTSKARLKKALDTLDGTFICKQNGIYRSLHDKLFDFLAYYFGQKMIECLIDHGDSKLVHERFIWQSSPDDENSNIDFSIEIPNDNLNSYLQRFIKDWLAGKVTLAFNNTNTQVSSFRQMLLEHLKQLNHSQQVTLANTKDTVEPKESCASGNTPLLMFCCHGYTDMVQWIIHHDVDVDQCRDDGVTGLGFASQNGHIDIVKLLLEKGPNVNQCDKDGRSPLLQVCHKGHTDIVTLLLEKNSNVDQFDKDGCSPLLQAIQNGHADIVRLLLEMNPDVDQCTKYGLTPLILACSKNDIRVVQLLLKHKPKINAQTSDGGIALYFSVRNGIIEITELLLENNADCNICAYSKQTVTETVNIRPLQTLKEYKQSLFDNLVTATSNHVTDYVSSKSVEYAFDVETGSSPLHIACFIGRKDAVHCLLNYNANINIKKEDGTTPLFYACEVGHDNIVRLLLDEGADAHICRLDGKSPLNIATDNGHTSIVKIITEHMEKENPLL